MSGQRSGRSRRRSGAENVDRGRGRRQRGIALAHDQLTERASNGCGADADADATEADGGRLPSDRGTRDVFPLPRLTSPLPPCMISPLSQQRWRRQSHHQWSECYDYSLNWLAGYKEPSRQLVPPRVVFERRGLCKVSTVIHFISSDVDSWHWDEAPARASPRAAFSKLLRGRGYDDAVAAGPHLPLQRPGLASRHCTRLPVSLGPCRFGRVSGAHAAGSCPLLRYSRKEYRRFASRLLAIGAAGLALECRERIGVSVVKKDGGVCQRLIVDARRANRHFRAPPPVPLPTAAGFWKIECVEVPSGVDSCHG